ncbi:MAG TPA: D-arabinose 5-phosphate isomerase [Gammaproteobacteria bacterium]|jgi:arabinose-5-phosphate isomerase|nr:D-arabinose 5-phosphate isomerase [Gammaproteobacteria bacterium]
MNLEKIRAAGRAVVDTEAQALTALAERIDGTFDEACSTLLSCQGRIIVSGMGKSGHIAGKIAATLASTGSPAFFVHPGEASHGDLGMIKPEDVVIAISNSGNSPELLLILPMIKRMGVPLITLTGKPDSPMAKLATINLDVSVDREACPLNLAPTASTTTTLAMGDALAIALLEARGFSMDDFAASHPGGSLGRRLLLRVDDIMATDTAVPIVAPDTLLPDALMTMTQSGFGMTMIADHDKRLLGVFTDGDLRRAIDQRVELTQTPVSNVMTVGGKTITPDTLASDALDMMEHHKINALPVIVDNNRICGALKMHDLLASGVV